MSLHEQQESEYTSSFCYSFCSITCENSLNWWLFMTKHIIIRLCPSTHVVVSHFVLGNHCLWKKLKYFLSHKCKSPSKESPVGMCIIISGHGLAWSHKCWQFLPLGTKRQRRLPDKRFTWLTPSLSVHRTSVTQGIAKSMAISLFKYSRY